MLHEKGKGMSHLKFALLSLLVGFFSLSVLSGFASPANMNSSPPNVDVLQQSCAVLEIHLSGSQYSTNCLHTHLQSSPPPAVYSGIAPNTASDPNCNEMDTAQVWHNADTQLLCFVGTGYFGTTITQVNQVLMYPPVLFGWIRWYRGGPGNYCTIVVQGSAGYAYWGSGITNVEVTQLDPESIRNSQDPVCPV
jgi:hypothetical protein